MIRFKPFYRTPRQLFPSLCRFASTSGTPETKLLPSAAGTSAYLLRDTLDKERERNALSMSTLLSHAGLPMHNNATKGGVDNKALSPPIILATTYERPPDGNYGENDFIYSRESNPTRKLLEDVMGELETSNSSQHGHEMSGKSAPSYAFSSGMAAIASLILAHKSPVKLLIPQDVYHGVPTQLVTALNDHGVLHQAVDMTNCDELRHIITQEVLKSSGKEGSLIVWMETPSNPLCQVTNIQMVCDIVNEVRSSSTNDKFRITSVVDSTWAPPCITQPLLLGADAVLHSGTKYLGGHSDVLLGIVCPSPFTTQGEWLSERLEAVQSSVGAVASPLECWLTLRGLRTLHLRVERQCRSTWKLAQYLEAHKDVVKCHYPGLKSHPQHAIATQQMRGTKSSTVCEDSGNDSILYGGMLSFEVESEAMAMAVAGAVRIIRRATSLGGTETLIEHRASIEPPERRTSPPGLLRVSVGLEDVKDLWSDLETALMVASKVCLNKEV
ncbi:hypothetical protein HJC23_006120 [Cyclotella cryptica]|uniref:cystathionine gamma-lyase n=1 Tax=Cyclotella cryptica TaxID=29204 RepID=A0ABD3QJM1_9STRA